MYFYIFQKFFLKNLILEVDELGGVDKGSWDSINVVDIIVNLN